MKRILFSFAILLAATLSFSGAPPDRLPTLTAPAEARTVQVIVGQPPPAAPAATNYTEDANCVGAWFMNGTTTEEDRSGKENTLNQTSGTIPTSADVPTGYSGTSRDFASADTEDLEGDVTSGTELHITTSSITIAAWIKTSTDFASTAHVAGIYDTGSNQRMYRLGVTTSETVAFYVSSDGTAVTSVTGGTDIVDGAWHHIAGVFDNTNNLIYIYVDGVSDADAVSFTSDITAQTEEFGIGGFSASSALFNGLIDEVIVFNRALSSSEISNMKTNGISGDKGGSD